MLPVVLVDGRVVLVPFDGGALAATGLGTVLNELKCVATALPNARRSADYSVVGDVSEDPALPDDIYSDVLCCDHKELSEADEAMIRREVLRLTSVAGALLITQSGELHLDWERLVNLLTGRVHTGGWLRFDGSRLAEERGACYVELKRPDLAEVVLTQALSQDLSPRRRGSVLIDLATMGLQCRDSEQLVRYVDAALDTVRQTGSGVISRKLHGLQARLAPFTSDRYIRHLDEKITAVTRTFAS